MNITPRLPRRALACVHMAGAALMMTGVRAAVDAKPWPAARPITWIVGFPPGGTLDLLTRVAARKLAEKTGQPVIVDNRPGASGAIGLQLAAKAAPDGYTQVTVPGPILFAQHAPEIRKELLAVAWLAQGPMVLVGPASNAPSTVAELVAAMRKDPKSWTYASSGNRTSQHPAGELFNVVSGTAMAHVPYNGWGQAVTDVVGGQVRWPCWA